MKVKIFLSAIILFCVSEAFAAASSGISASASADRDVMTIGDNINVTAVIDFPEGYRVIPPENRVQIGDWEVRGIKIEPGKNGGTGILYTLTIFSTGSVVIPELNFQLFAADGSTVPVNTQSIPVKVESVLGLAKGKEGLRDIKSPLSLRIPAGVYLSWLALLAALGAAGWFWYVRMTKKAVLPAQPALPPVPPRQTALEELEKLRNSRLAGECRTKEFYITLSDIIRKYIGTVYAVDTTERTTGEIYFELRPRLRDKKALLSIKDFLEECDLVKFAKYTPDEKALWADFASAEKIAAENG